MDLIENFTGIDIHYESSTSLGLKTFTGTSDIQHSVDEIIAYLSNKDIIYSRTG
jgi:adenylylsulfate kinase-like enzyme